MEQSGRTAECVTRTHPEASNQSIEVLPVCHDHGRRLFQRQAEGRLAPCAMKRLRFNEDRRKMEVAACAKHIDQITDPQKIMGQVRTSVLMELVFKAKGPNCFIFELEGSHSDLQRLLAVDTVYGEDQRGEDVQVKFISPPPALPRTMGAPSVLKAGCGGSGRGRVIQ